MEAVEIIIAIGGVATALTAIWAIVYGITKWVHKQNTQSTDIEALEKKHDEDTRKIRQEEQEELKSVKDELCVLAYSLLAVLDGLKQQGCNGEVTKAHASLEKYLNQKAHGQK